MDTTAGTSKAHAAATADALPSSSKGGASGPIDPDAGADGGHWFWSARFRLWVSIVAGSLLLVGAVGSWVGEGAGTGWPD